MEAPIGFIPLRDAVDMVGRKLFGTAWRSLGEVTGEDVELKRNLEVERVITIIAERCESGEIAAAYRSITGADSLDRAVWQKPHWRNYFVTGEINLELPLLDVQGRPNADGFKASCTREIFVRKDDLNCLVATLSKLNIKPSSNVRGSKTQIREMATRYRQTLSPNVNPSIEGFEQFARDGGLTGHRDELREEYHRQFPGQRVGRPSK